MLGKLGQRKFGETALWGPLLEKAWAKMKGSYANSNIGFVQNSFRALLGCPVFDYKTSSLDPEENWLNLHQVDIDGQYMMGAQTDGETDQLKN